MSSRARQEIWRGEWSWTMNKQAAEYDRDDGSPSGGRPLGALERSPELFKQLIDSMGDEPNDPYSWWLNETPDGTSVLEAKRINGLDHRVLFVLNPTECRPTLRMVVGVDWGRYALGLGRTWFDAPLERGTHFIKRHQSGLPLILIEIPWSESIPAERLLEDLITLEFHFYEDLDSTEVREFDISTDPFSAVIPYFFTTIQADIATWIGV